MNLTINDINDTKCIATILAQHVKPNNVILLKGDLGVGKTTFSQFFGEALGVEGIISSPTFNIIKSYDARLPFHHMDCYRLEGAEDDLGFDDYFYGNGVCLVEWPQMIEDFLPEDYLTIEILRVDEMRREMMIVANGKQSVQLLEVLNDEITKH
ncbi:tRNA (adenosine(37)-N6)-threonylcarbamoyltransferase complex ATPase subunit type 1 TsaE [Macrococcus sp. DPC7161]|uniref:tRNA (adenosine(37)-N6)-threonylcarbamoyltransferase complex ATPase subunit type 1 TsaE n=1 Tax=Macrococcus sp. DPC7161 TaxID=2507060 RepID=UPI00100BC0EF|nr:tRNA (adenosine(37)-N6)-threonylcarbamoyltransferase complex ATPase subunit type 1 TsaE [Macrococcus sp. DPC7161]RXK17865.1 tRNA (adenosine(37)-N6)-threonylcarbamoyltransferase complex ATPase subunit type 1 TsaE [Macrococcus sp. DPC7161]